jgi:hypothetical protein
MEPILLTAAEMWDLVMYNRDETSDVKLLRQAEERYGQLIGLIPQGVDEWGEATYQHGLAIPLTFMVSICGKYLIYKIADNQSPTGGDYYKISVETLIRLSNK